MSEGPGSRCIVKILVLEADNMASKPGVRGQSDVHMAAGPRTRNSWLHCRFPEIICHPRKGSPFKSLLALTSWDVCCWSWSSNTAQSREEPLTATSGDGHVQRLHWRDGSKFARSFDLQGRRCGVIPLSRSTGAVLLLLWPRWSLFPSWHFCAWTQQPSHQWHFPPIQTSYPFLDFILPSLSGILEKSRL